MQANPDVIIVGAGAAGLSAAKALSRLGLSYTVVEASHRIGGRAYSEEIAPGVWFDLGCAWLTGGADNPFVPVADALGVTLGKDKSDCFKGENLRYHRNTKRLTDDQRIACLRFFVDSYQAIATAAKEGRDVAVSDVVDIENEYAPPLLGGMAAAWGFDVDLISTADAASAVGELGFPVLHGYGNLIAAWGADVPVSLNTSVDQIDWSGRQLVVTTSKGTMTGRAVLSTVSTGILGSADIRFTPDLPDWKTQAIHNLPMGTENKMGIHFDVDVFGEQGRAYHCTWNDDGTMAKVHASVMGLNTASVFVGGRHAVWLEKQGQQACHEFAVDRVADIFGNDIRKHVYRSIVTAWNTEPWTRGSWACALPGQAHERAELQRCVDGRLFFAGEATVYSAQGTCHGAYQSGIQAAEEIFAQLKSPLAD